MPKPRPSPVLSTRLSRAARYAACADASSLLRAVGVDGAALLGAYLGRERKWASHRIGFSVGQGYSLWLSCCRA